MQEDTLGILIGFIWGQIHVTYIKDLKDTLLFLKGILVVVLIFLMMICWELKKMKDERQLEKEVLLELTNHSVQNTISICEILSVVRVENL